MDSRTSLGQEAMDRVTGAAKRMAGAVTGSEDLEREGDLHREKAQSIRSAREQRERAELTEELTVAEMAQREAADLFDGSHRFIRVSSCPFVARLP